MFASLSLNIYKNYSGIVTKKFLIVTYNIYIYIERVAFIVGVEVVLLF